MIQVLYIITRVNILQVRSYLTINLVYIFIRELETG